MPIYKLTPIDLDHPDWQASTHKAPVIIRAKDTILAREAANMAFAIAVVHRPGENTICMPWNQSSHATCEQLTEHEFDEEGPDQVLEPEGRATRLVTTSKERNNTSPLEQYRDHAHGRSRTRGAGEVAQTPGRRHHYPRRIRREKETAARAIDQ